MPSSTNYERIVEHLLTAIRAGRYQAGDCLPSSNELARQFGVSRNTTVRALQELIRSGAVHAVRGAGTIVNAPSTPSQTFLPRHNLEHPNLGILLTDVDDVNHPFCRKYISNIGNLASEAGCSIRIFPVAPNQMRNFLQERPFDGLLVLGEFPREIIDMLVADAIPTVLVANDWPGVQISAVMPETAVGVAKSFALLHRKGRRRFLVVPGPAGTQILNTFYTVYRQQIEHLRLAEDDCRFAACEWGESAGYELGKKIFQTGYRPDVLLAGEDYLACGIIRAAQEVGLRMPQDISVIGGGNYDNLPGGIRLSSTDALSLAFATEAINLLRKEIRGESRPGTKIYLKTQLIQRRESL